MTNQNKACEKLIAVGIKRIGRTVFCPDLSTLSLALGSKSVAGNLNAYSVKKQAGEGFLVSVDTIKERIKELTKRKEKIDQYLQTMKQVVR